MTRIAATMLGLALVAFSIGFNTVRYPVVWEMLAGKERSRSAEVAVAPQPQKSDAPASEEQSAPKTVQPPKPIEVKPVAKVAESKTKEKDVVSSRSAEADATGAKQPDKAGEDTRKMDAQLSLVPVTRLVSSGESAVHGAVGGGEIRRLPPVDKAAKLPDFGYASAKRGEAIPFYPTTGIE